MDYIDRTKGGAIAPDEERMIFFDEPPQHSGIVNPADHGITYEESVDAANLYNPLSGTVKSSTIFSGNRIYP